MRENFCAAPWSSLSLDPDGLAKLCCVSQHRVPLTELSQAHTDNTFIKIRQSVINDHQNTNCQHCWNREKTDSSWESRRSIYQYDYFHDLNNADQFRLEHLDLRWSNTCNLNCVYCNPTFSSKWAQLKGQKQKFRISPEVHDNDLANLKVLQLAGGEPLLIKENLIILNRIHKLNPEVKIEVTTNLTQIKDNLIYKILKNFKNVNFVVSFESTADKFEYIRNQAVWVDFQDNLKILSGDFLNIQFNMVYFPLSSLDIVSAMKVALTYTLPENIFIVEQFGGHGFDMLSQNAVQYIKQLNLNQSTDLPVILQQRFLDHVNLIATEQTQTFLPQYETFDQLINQDHKSIFKELYQ